MSIGKIAEITDSVDDVAAGLESAYRELGNSPR